MSEVSKSLIVSFDALNLVKGIKSIGGPDKQVFYIESNLFAPDRRITPLILQPYILVEDPHDIIPNGDKVGELSSAEWYFDEIKSENRITAKEENASIDTPFALGANNSLHIRKNVEKAIQLFFEAEYLDTRKNKNIHISLTYLLSTTSSSEVRPDPKLKLSKPQSWKYCPLDKVTEATIEAEVFADNKGYKSAVEWCKVEGDKVIALTDEPFVLGGQNTDKLIVNPHAMGDSLIRARNVSEEFYNKAYGINPDWDSKMNEVFENRNLTLSSSRVAGADYWIGVKNLAEPWEIGQSYRVSVKPTTIKDGNFVWFYTNTGTGEAITALTKANNYTNTFVYTDKIPQQPGGNNICSFFQKQANNSNGDTLIVLENIMITKGKEVKPYTPAPEDLNFRNYLLDSGVFTPNEVSPNLTIKKDIEGVEFISTKGVEIPGSSYVNFKHNIGIQKTKNPKLSSPLMFSCEVMVKDSNLGIPQFYLNNKTYYKQLIGALEDGKWSIVYFLFPENKSDFIFHIGMNKCKGDYYFKNFMMNDVPFVIPWRKAPEDYAPDGILQGTYQSDIKFTKYFPDINAEILFLTGDSIRPEHKTVKAQAVFTTNKEPIKNPSEFFDIEWYLDPVEAGGEVKKIGTGEFMEIPVSDLQLKGGRLVPIRLKYNFK